MGSMLCPLRWWMGHTQCTLHETSSKYCPSIGGSAVRGVSYSRGPSTKYQEMQHSGMSGKQPAGAHSQQQQLHQSWRWRREGPMHGGIWRASPTLQQLLWVRETAFAAASWRNLQLLCMKSNEKIARAQ